MKFRENRSSGNSSFMWTDKRTDGKMDRYDKANSHFSQFCKHAWKVNNMAENTQER
jgi:hypothetical protein